MRLSSKTLLIVANPFAAPLSAEGRATALCPADPAEGGGRYVGARTKAATVKQPPGMRSPFGPRDKVSVMYDLRPVTAGDTSYYRAALKSGDAMPAEGAAERLESLARASLAAFVAGGGDRAQALAEWRKQGLAAVADAIDPPQPDKSADPPQPDATAIEGAVS
jgi:hypothetical protein